MVIDLGELVYSSWRFRRLLVHSSWRFTPRGEFTIVIGPVALAALTQPASEDELLETARQALVYHRAAGKRGRDAVAEVVASTGLPRRAVYALWVETGASPTERREQS